jgi:regulatory protein
MTREQLLAYDKAAILCSRSEKCTSEILEKLKLYGLSVEESLPVINQLKAEKYLDDERFARAYVKDKFRFNHWGRQKIEFMLRSKKISQEILELAFEEIVEDDYSEGLLKLISDKAISVKAKDKYDKRNKLMRFAMGRGFESNKIYAAFKELGI